jgi:hypothetical protein
MSGADSDGSMVNLRENLKSIGAYIKNREQMFEEMIRSIRGAKLQAMIPSFLKVGETSQQLSASKAMLFQPILFLLLFRHFDTERAIRFLAQKVFGRIGNHVEKAY